MASEYDAYDAILHHIFKQTQGEAWFKPLEENLQAGVALRIDNNPPRYRVFPYENLKLAPFEAAVRALNPLVAVKVRSASVHAALSTVADQETGIFLDNNSRIQIIDTISSLSRADKEQGAAFVRDERVLICWSDHLDGIIPICQDLENRLIKLVWKLRPVNLNTPGLSYHSRNQSFANLTNLQSPPGSENGLLSAQRPQTPFDMPATPGTFIHPGVVEVEFDDPEAAKPPIPRPTRVLAPIYNGLSAGLAIFFMGSGLRMLLMEYLLDGSLIRFGLIAAMPFLFCVSLFFASSVISAITMVIGPVAQFHENSKYYSAIKPRPNPTVDRNLPHITIQMAVYKESLTETIAPSCESIKKAMQTYARQGGTSTIMICDDGMQLIPPEQAEARRQYYADHGIGWVARPGHSDKPGGFKRAGRFKKASNLNYALELSQKMEKQLDALLQDEKLADRARLHSQVTRRLEMDQGTYGSTGVFSNVVSGDDEKDDGDESLEDLALRAAVEEVYNNTGKRYMPWAANGRALRLGEIILMVDSDTIVPEDCLRDAAREMGESPELAVIQHESDVMQVAHHYFENGIAHFTRRINKAISFAAANGEVGAFVGHNAFLRWSALQDVAFIDKADGKRKIWSESNVSEDFDMALRLQLGGYILRWASYSHGGFKEGVSLTCDDELNRWEKYAYGCSELIFNPFVQWFTKGPINHQLHKFVWGPAPLHYKLSMLAYCFSYYGIAAGFTLTLLNYLLLGWQLPVDGFYLRSFEIWIAISVVFPVAGNIGFTLLEYRLGLRSLISSFLENIMWIPYFLIFFGGISIHLSKALLAHMFSYNITWGATKKEVERSNFFLEVPKIIVRFRVAFVLCFISIAGMVILTTPIIPPEWQIPGYMWSVIFPLANIVACHVLYPIVLNPYLMVFSY